MSIEAVKQRLDIVEVIGEYVTLQRAGRNYKARCPFHEERTPSFTVSPDRQTWHCFGACGTGGDVISFIMKKENLDFGEALRMLAERAGVPLSDRASRTTEQDERLERLRQANEAAAGYYHHLLLNAGMAAEARAYLERRGLDGETIRSFQLGYSPDRWDTLRNHLRDRGFSDQEQLQAGLLVEGERGGYDRFRNRLMFPIRDAGGRVIGFGARALGDQNPKYLNTPQSALFDKSAVLYGIDRARDAIRRADRAVVVEGYMDAIAAHQHGYANVVASMGTALTERQVNVVKRYTRNLVLALDADAAGSEATLRGIQVAASAMDAGVVAVPDWRGLVRLQESLASDIRVLRLPEGKDPDEAIRKAPDGWPALVDGAKPVVDFLFEAVAAKLDLANPRERSRAVEELLPVLLDIGDRVVQAHYLQRLARLAQVDERTLMERARAEGRRPRGRRTGDQQPPERKAAARSLPASPQAEYALALLLRYPDALREPGRDLPEWLFSQSEHRRIHEVWRGHQNGGELRDLVGEELHDCLDRVQARRLPPYTAEQAREALDTCIQRAMQQRLRELAEAKAAIVADLEERMTSQEYLQAALNARQREAVAGNGSDSPDDEAGAAAVEAMQTGAQFYRWMYEQQRRKSVH